MGNHYMSPRNILDLHPGSFQCLVMDHHASLLEIPFLLVLEMGDPFHVFAVGLVAAQLVVAANAFEDRLESLQKDQNGSMAAQFYLELVMAKGVLQPGWLSLF